MRMIGLVLQITKIASPFFDPAEEGAYFQAADEGADRGRNFEGDDYAAVKEGFHFVDGVTVEDHLAVDAEESLGVQHSFYLVDGFEDGVLFFIKCIEVNDFAFQCYDRDVFDGDGIHFLPEFDQEGRLRPGRALAELFQLVKSLFDILFVKGFEDIVDAVGFKGLQQVGVEGGAKDDRGGDGHLPEDIEAAAIGQLDVHEQEVDTLGSGGKEGYRTLDAVADGQDLVFFVDGCDKFSQQSGGSWFVFNDEDIHLQ
jgi:hypothetical protein